MKTLKKALTIIGILSVISGFTSIGCCISLWKFTAMPIATFVAALGIVCLDLAGAFDWW